MDIKELIARYESDESLELEFKSAVHGLPESLWESVSAFANTAGGWILLGVRQEKDTIRVEGVRNEAQLRQDIHNLMRNPEKISREVCGPHDISAEKVDGADVVMVRVHGACAKEKPVFLIGNPYKGTFVRRNEGDYRCTKQEVDRMIRDACVESADSAVLKGHGWPEIDRDTFKRYRGRFRQFNDANPWNDYDDDRFLAAIGGYRKDAASGAEGFTRAAVLMFGTREALLNLRIRHLIDFRLLPENDEDLRWADRITWEGNLYDAFFRIYPRLVEPLKTPFKLEGPHRVTETPAHEALRECLVNMLAHADYAEQAALLVTASPREFVFRNPGSSRVPEEDLLTKDCSDPRNPVLLRMFRYVALADEAGTGLPKVLRVWRAQGLQLPSLHSDTERYEFKATLRLVHLLSEKDRAWLAWCAKANMGAEQAPLSGMVPLGPNEQLALIQARNEESVNNAAVQALTGLHRADVTQLLGALRDRGLLEQESTRRWASYRLPNKIRQSYSDIVIKKSDKEAVIVTKKKAEIRRAIIRLCHSPRSSNDLAEVLKMTRSYVVNKYLAPMVKQGLLVYTKPQVPKAKDQKYVAPKLQGGAA